ncbi:hypothetical protein ID866_5233 [Astraeus odoratus]|nr:hypothetical protein ID866_5233 [Astraeus odoratus]
MNCDACDIPSMKRKKAPTEKDERDVEIKTCDQLSSTHLCEVVDDSTVSMILPGCGRIICRACCVESVAKYVTSFFIAFSL